MERNIIFEDYTLEPIDIGMEMNYLVRRGSCYVCRLVPSENGFGVAEYDKICELPAGEVTRISEFIRGKE